VAEVKFASTFEGKKAQHLVEQGVLKATSVGFRPLEYIHAKDVMRAGGLDFKSQELMEFSVVPVPANPECLICLSPKEEQAERKAERQADLEEIIARQKALDARLGKPLETRAEKRVSEAVQRIRAKRAERQRVQAMGPDEYRIYLDEKAARKAEREATAKRLLAND